MGCYRVAAIAALTLAGCGGVATRPTGPVTLQEAVQNLDAGLARVPHVSSSDLAGDAGGRRYDAAKRIVREKQCAGRTANPLLLTSLPFDVRLTGNVSGDGKIEISGASAEGRVGSTRLASEKEVEVLLRISNLADLPNEYLKGMSALLQAKGLPNEVAQKLKKEVLGTYETLSTRVKALMSDFDLSGCGGLARQAVRAKESRPESNARIFPLPPF